MVWGIDRKKRYGMPPHIIPQNIRVNNDANIEVLDKVNPWINIECNRKPVFQKDSASSHTTKTTRKWMADNFHNDFSLDI